MEADELLTRFQTLNEKVDDLESEVKRLRGQVLLFDVRLLSKSRAAKRLGIDRGAALDFLIETKQLRTVRVGKRVKIPASEVERLAREGFKRPRSESSSG